MNLDLDTLSLWEQIPDWILSAVAVGGILYTFKFWKQWKIFALLWVGIVVGCALGVAMDTSFEGARTGLAFGAISLPAVRWVRGKFGKYGKEEEDVE